MSRQRFEFALERLDDSLWPEFERFCSTFLSSEFTNIRTMANPSGDGGRDALLFTPEHEADIVIQYSVSRNWASKIQQTAQRISELEPPPRYLIYCTNQKIGARVDDIRKKLRSELGVHLDVRDASWFLDRSENSQQSIQVFESLAVKVADPYLSSRGMLEKHAQALTNWEQKAAFVYLSLQWEDDNREKNLTRTCFEALVRNALLNSSPDNRISRKVIHQRVASILPHHPRDQIEKYTEQAIHRLAKKSIRHYQKDDSFCFSHEEMVRLNNRLAARDLAISQIDQLFVDVTNRFFLEQIDTQTIESLARRARRCFDIFLFQLST